MTDQIYDTLFAEREMLIALGEDATNIRTLPGDLLESLYPEFFILTPEMRKEIGNADKAFPLSGEAMKFIFFVITASTKNYGRRYARTEKIDQIPFLRNMELLVKESHEIASMLNRYKENGLNSFAYSNSIKRTTNALNSISKQISEYLPRRPYFHNREENLAFTAAAMLCLNPFLLNCYPEHIREKAESLKPQFLYVLRGFEGFVLHNDRKGELNG